MTRPDDDLFDPRIADWLESDPDRAPRQVTETVLAAFPSIPQRRASRAPWRSPTMTRFAPLAAGVAAVAVLLVGGLLLLGPRSAPGVVGSPTGPSPSPSSSPSPSPSTVSGLPDYTGLQGWLVFEHFGQAPDGSTTTMDYDRRQVWLVHADGTGLHELAPGAPADGKASPDISPDGTRVIFNSWTPKRQVWEADLAGGAPRLVSTDCDGVEGSCWAEDPAYSPDGGRIAYVLTTKGKSSTIAIRDLASGRVTTLAGTSVPTSVGWDAQPDWSPDGTRIVYHRNTQGPSDPKPTAGVVEIVNADGTGLRQLTPAGRNAFDADWSPDGTTIVYADSGFRETEGVAGAPQDIYTIRPDGSGDRLLAASANSSGEAPSWTPDGKHILYWGFRTPNLMDPDGSNAGPINAKALDYFGDTLGYGYSWHLQPNP